MRVVQLIPLIATFGIFSGLRIEKAGLKDSLHQLTFLSPQLSENLKEISDQVKTLQGQLDSLTAAEHQA